MVLHSLSLSAPSPAHSQRLVNVKSRLKQAPRYPSLDRELVEYQERQLFEYFVVVSLHKKQAGTAQKVQIPLVDYFLSMTATKYLVSLFHLKYNGSSLLGL